MKIASGPGCADFCDGRRNEPDNGNQHSTGNQHMMITTIATIMMIMTPIKTRPIDHSCDILLQLYLSFNAICEFVKMVFIMQ